jgi:L-malate glycosyltransferase
MSTSPRLAFVGPMLGRHPGWPVSQGEVLGDLLDASGYEVVRSSDRINPWLRGADTVRSVWRWRNEVDLALVSIYGGRSFSQAEAAAHALRRAGIPQMHVLHGGSLLEFAARRRRRVSALLGKAEAIVAPSAFLAGVATLTGLPVTIIPNVIDLPHYSYTWRREVKPRLLWMRTFAPLYAPELAVQAFALVLRDFPEATLTMAGQDRGRLAAVQALCDSSGIEDRVRFPGFLDDEGKRREFADHDIFLNTNRIDNMPVSVVEACAFGLPVVATAVGGLPDLLEDERTGMLVAPDDPAAMAASVVRLLRDAGLAERLSETGRALAESCAWSAVRPQWEDLFRRATVDQGGGY